MLETSRRDLVDGKFETQLGPGRQLSVCRPRWIIRPRSKRNQPFRSKTFNAPPSPRAFFRNPFATASKRVPRRASFHSHSLVATLLATFIPASLPVTLEPNVSPEFPPSNVNPASTYQLHVRGRSGPMMARVRLGSRSRARASPISYLLSPISPSSFFILPSSFTCPQLAQHMRVNLRRRYILVPEEFLNRPDVIPCFKRMRSKAMPQRMTRRRLVHLRCPDRGLDRRLNPSLTHMRPHLPAPRIHRQSLRRNTVPCPFPTGIRPFSSHRGQIHVTIPGRHIRFVLLSHRFQMLLQRFHRTLRQHRSLGSFAPFPSRTVIGTSRSPHPSPAIGRIPIRRPAPIRDAHATTGLPSDPTPGAPPPTVPTPRTPPSYPTPPTAPIPPLPPSAMAMAPPIPRPIPR